MLLRPSEASAISFMVAICIFAVAAPSKEILTDFSDAVRVSTLIARIRVEESREATYSIAGEERSCGQVYKAVALETLKGQKGAFEFLGPQTPKLEIGRQYLAFLWTYTADDRARVDRDPMSDDEIAYHECRIRAPELIPVDEQHLSIVPFRSPPGGDLEKPPELEADRFSVVSWLKADDGRIRWDAVKRSIEDELRDPEPQLPLE